MLRQKINRDTLRSERGVAGGLGDHWSYDSARFVREGFLDMLNVMGNNALGSFDFAAEIAEIDARTIEIERTYLIPMDIVKYVELPNYLRAAF